MVLLSEPSKRDRLYKNLGFCRFISTPVLLNVNLNNMLEGLLQLLIHLEH